jgi:branched-chain amino acid aminotransferase
MIKKYPAWLNGNYCNIEDLKISVLDLGLIHCDATYEVINSKNRKIFMLDEHLDRFWNSCQHWRLPIPLTKDELKEIILTLCQKANESNLLVWIGITRGIPESGSPRDLTSSTPNLFLYVKPYFGFSKTNTASVCIAKNIRVPDFSINQKFKNFAWNDLTIAQWEAIDRGYDTAILLSYEGFVTEGPGFNVFFIKNKTIYTPNTNCLGGITVMALEKICKEAGYTFVKIDLTVEDIAAMDYAGIASTAGNLIPILKIEDKTFNDNEVFKQLQSLIERKTDEWITEF